MIKFISLIIVKKMCNFCFMKSKIIMVFTCTKISVAFFKKVLRPVTYSKTSQSFIYSTDLFCDEHQGALMLQDKM